MEYLGFFYVVLSIGEDASFADEQERLVQRFVAM